MPKFKAGDIIRTKGSTELIYIRGIKYGLYNMIFPDSSIYDFDYKIVDNVGFLVTDILRNNR